MSKLLLRWFDQYQKQLRIVALAEVRTQIVERARYRLPDVMVLTCSIQARRLVSQTPDVVIEIVSPDDRYDENLSRLRDYSQLGVQHLIQMHPEQYIAWRFQNDSLIKTDFQFLDLPGSRLLPFDSEALFAQLRQEIAEFER